MKREKQDSGSDHEGELEQETRLEEAWAKRLKAEENLRKQEMRESAREELHEVSSVIPAKAKLICGAVLIVVAIGFFGFALPYILDDHQNQYFSESDLKTAVDIDNLSAIDYAYCGIAEKRGKILWQDTVDYRVKYKAHVRASYKLSDIEFSIDDNSKVVTAYLPEATISKPQLDQNKFGYLPAGAKADIKDVIALCREDAASDLNKEEIQKEAASSLQDTVTALTLPFLGDSYRLEFKPKSEWGKGVEVND